MKLITAVLQPHAAPAVIDALREHGAAGLTVTEVVGYGRQGGHTEVYRGAEYQIDTIPKAKIEIVVGDESMDEVVELITRTARSGRIGDGKVWVTDIVEVVRVRTGERGADAV
jgi:nitrogen regulatory protein P-II 1